MEVDSNEEQGNSIKKKVVFRRVNEFGGGNGVESRDQDVEGNELIERAWLNEHVMFDHVTEDYPWVRAAIQLQGSIRRCCF